MHKSYNRSYNGGRSRDPRASVFSLDAAMSVLYSNADALRDDSELAFVAAMANRLCDGKDSTDGYLVAGTGDSVWAHPKKHGCSFPNVPSHLCTHFYRIQLVAQLLTWASEVSENGFALMCR